MAVIGAALWIFLGWDSSIWYLDGFTPVWFPIPLLFYLFAGLFLILYSVNQS
jgi:hypothetical protein